MTTLALIHTGTFLPAVFTALTTAPFFILPPSLLFTAIDAGSPLLCSSFCSVHGQSPGPRAGRAPSRQLRYCIFGL